MNFRSASLFLATSYCLITATTARAATLHWLVAHDPSDQYVSTLVQKHADAINQKTKNALTVAVETYPKEIWANPGTWNTHWEKAYEKVMSGEVDVVQIPYYAFGSVFRDQAHVERAVTGAFGQDLLARVRESTGGKLRAFAFAYSGGFRILATTKPVRTAEDFVGLRVLDETDLPADKSMPIANSFRAFGATEVHFQPDLYQMMKDGKVEGLATTYKELLGFMPPYGTYKPVAVTDDHMFLFTTLLVMNEASYQKLSAEQKELLTKNLVELATEEREAFSKGAEEIKRNILPKRGVSVTHLSAADREKLRTKAEPLYKWFRTLKGGAELLEKAKSTDGSTLAEINSTAKGQ
jgi:TRAP-type C4-dicarboxylate transport system substrate-binding protein